MNRQAFDYLGDCFDMSTNDIINLLLSGKPLESNVRKLIAGILAEYQNLNVTQETNIEVLRSQINQMAPYVNQHDILQSEITTLKESRDSYINAWHNTIRNEIDLPAYEELRAKQNAVAIFEVLSQKDKKTFPDPVPVAEVLDDFLELICNANLSLGESKKQNWLKVLQTQMNLISQAPFVSRSSLKLIQDYAVKGGILNPDYEMGVKVVSRLEQLGIEGVVKTPNDISIAMNWS